MVCCHFTSKGFSAPPPKKKNLCKWKGRRGLHGATGAIRRSFMIFISITFQGPFFALDWSNLTKTPNLKGKKRKQWETFFFFFYLLLFMQWLFWPITKQIWKLLWKKFPLPHHVCRKLAQQEDRDSSQLVNVHASMQGRDVTLWTQTCIIHKTPF